MRRGLALLTLGLLALFVQGGLSVALPPPYCPDLGLLVVLALGIIWPGVFSGILLSAGLGFAADLLSGSLFGQHMLLRTVAYAAAHIASRQLNLRGALPLGAFAALATLCYGLLGVALTRFFAGPAPFDASLLWRAIVHAMVTGLCAPAVARAAGAFASWAKPEEGSRRALRVEARERTT